MTPRNALALATSPYLLQHADNPVDWHPWGAEALALAAGSGRPILLSIGYSACHWCHVMAHESFEDEATAALMNAHFVNIKVDREERPDLDRIYQLAHQLLARRPGGWPLTMFLTHDDQTPFFGGTYFPRESRYGLPGFRDLLLHVASVYRDRRDDVHAQNARMREALQELLPRDPPRTDGLDPRPIGAAVAELLAAFDPDHGGFGSAPKFPHPGHIRLLLDAGLAQAPAAGALEAARHTLVCMAEGGLFDQLAGGFCRYSVDERWLIPHFEKMLYDNGPLLGLYAEAWAACGEPLFHRVAAATAGWMLTEMRNEAGAFCSSLDADSEGHEGRFYVWDRDEVAALLAPQEFAVLAAHYGLDAPANFEGAWHLHVAQPLARVAVRQNLDPEAAEALLARGRERLLAHRATRVRPGRDDKILAAWNALAIHGLAIAGRRLDRPEWLDAASAALDFCRNELWRDGRLHATWRLGEARLDAYLDDHAFLIEAALALMEARWRDEDLAFARLLAATLLDRFEDRELGGFHFTAHDHERLIQRPKSFADDALPSGNGVAARALFRLAALTGETHWAEAAERTVRAGFRQMERHPSSHGAMLEALALAMTPPVTVVLRGEAATTRAWQRSIDALGIDARRACFRVPEDARDLPPLLAARRSDGPARAWVCRGATCLPPFAERDALLAALSDAPAASGLD